MYIKVSAVVALEPDHVGTLYSYLTSKPEYQTSDSRKALVKRIREALVKLISLIGVCKPMEAIFALTKVEKPEDQDFSFSREHWQSGQQNRKRGGDWLNVIYKENLSTATDKFVAHKDFDFISKEITYGLYLSDHTILGPVETELVVLAGIAIQNLPIETAWHLRGARRVGISQEKVELIQQCVSLCIVVTTFLTMLGRACRGIWRHHLEQNSKSQGHRA